MNWADLLVEGHRRRLDLYASFIQAMEHLESSSHLSQERPESNGAGRRHAVRVDGVEWPAAIDMMSHVADLPYCSKRRSASESAVDRKESIDRSYDAGASRRSSPAAPRSDIVRHSPCVRRPPSLNWSATSGVKRDGGAGVAPPRRGSSSDRHTLLLRSEFLRVVPPPPSQSDVDSVMRRLPPPPSPLAKTRRRTASAL